MQIFISFISLFCVTLILGIVLMPPIITLAKDLHLYDLPDSRKVHKMPIPRLGGVTFLPIVTISIAMLLVVILRLDITIDRLWEGTAIQHFLAYISGAMMLYSVGLYDDIRGADYKVKFAIQFLSASLLCISGLWIADFGHVFFIDEVPYWIGMPFTVLFVMYITNAMNLIDGIDGLSSGLAAIALVVIAALNILVEEFIWALVSIAYLGVILAFFHFNVLSKKYKIFMGDAGSLTLGYTLAFLILPFWQRDPVWDQHMHNIGIVALSTLVIPAFDVVRVMMSRLRDGRNPFLPDKNHIHHKLLRAGFGPKTTTTMLLILAIGFIIANYLVASYISQTLMIVMDVVLFCLMHIIINIFIARKENAAGIIWDRVL